jgi:hypothetical protein
LFAMINDMETHKGSRAIMFTVVTVVVIGLLATSAYFSRAWLRQSAAPFYASTVYMPKIRNNFKKNVLPVNALMASYGFNYHKTETNFEGCGEPGFEGFGETIYCIKSLTSNKLIPSNALSTTWHKNSNSLERQLFASGWTKDNKTQPIGSLLDYVDANDVSQHDVSYRITKAGAECYFRISNSPSSHEVYSVEGCQHTVNFFGGY